MDASAQRSLSNSHDSRYICRASLARHNELHDRIVSCLEVDSWNDLIAYAEDAYTEDRGVRVEAPAVVDAYFD